MVGEIDGNVESIIEIVVDSGAEKGFCVVGWTDCDDVSENVVVSLDMVEEFEGGLVSITEIADDRGTDEGICVEGWKDCDVVSENVGVSLNVVVKFNGNWYQPLIEGMKRVFVSTAEDIAMLYQITLRFRQM